MKNQLKHLLLPAVCWLATSCANELPEEVAIAYQKLPAKIDFNFQVRPILSDRCFSCHGPDEKARKANLRLDTEQGAFAALKTPGTFAFIPRKPYASEAIHRILTEDEQIVMPPPESKISLTATEKAILIKWLEQGAEWKGHWAFDPPKKSDLPSTDEVESYNPIDHFIGLKLDQHQLDFSTPADKNTLIRRVTLDLTGLPPTPEEVEAFLLDKSPEAFEKVVDRLLSSPNFGERWAWDWLDAARYADTNGFQGDPERKMWPWREWVIKAFNNNMPYDQFTIEQLAGDLLPSPTTDQVLATAFNRNHMYNGEGGRIPEETRVENVFDRLETTGTIWLGLTFNCARCHDHKFDPITQREYYQLYDYFNQTSEKGLNGGGAIPPFLDLSPEKDQKELSELQSFVDQLGEKIQVFEDKFFPRETGMPAESTAAADLDGDNLYALTFAPKDRSSYLYSLLYKFYQNKAPKYADLLLQMREAMSKRNRKAGQNLLVMVMDEVETPRTTFVLEKGTYDQPREPVGRGVPEILPGLIDQPANNRLALAKWLVAKDHPLTARVTVNRFWQAFFGRGLVKTPDDFGIQGDQPSHPELLDWLAVDFVQHDWDIKALCKLIVQSRTYQQSSKLMEHHLEKDPENKWLSRGPRYRLPSWMIRDQALAISGLLYDTIGGASVKPYQPAGIWEEATFGKKRYVQDQGNDLYRRTLYTFWRRIVGPTMLFDNAPRQVCSVKPLLTNAPQHALITLNDITYLEAARVMAERVLTAKDNEHERLQFAFKIATARAPKTEELRVLKSKLKQFNLDFGADPASATAFLQVGEFPQRSDLDAKEHAAYTALCSMILNLDEVISKQ